MSLHRVAALFRRVALEIARDRPSLGLLFIAPMVMSGLVTFIIREGARPTIDAVIVNAAGLPGTVVAGQLRKAIVESGGTVRTTVDEEGARAAIQDGSSSVAIVLPAELASAETPSIAVITNGLDPLGEATELGSLQQTIMRTAASITGATVPTITHVTVYGAPSSDPIGRFAPAIVGFFAYFFVYILTGVSFLRERTGGTLERLMATPVARGEIVAGYALGFGMFAVIQMAVLLTWVLGTVHVPALGPLPEFSIGLGVATAGSALYAFLVVLLLALGAVSLGILISTFARTELQVIESIPIILVPQFLLSGVLFPLSGLPEVIQPLAYVMPVHYAVEGLRQVFVAGADLGTAALQANLIILTVFALSFATLASLTIRREVV